MLDVVFPGYTHLIFYFFQEKLVGICDFQQFGILTSVDSDELVHPPLKLRNSK